LSRDCILKKQNNILSTKFLIVNKAIFTVMIIILILCYSKLSFL